MVVVRVDERVFEDIPDSEKVDGVTKFLEWLHILFADEFWVVELVRVLSWALQ